jgi:hypothetical protein
MTTSMMFEVIMSLYSSFLATHLVLQGKELTTF